MNFKTEEIKVIAELPYSWEKIKDKTILVSGGTGFIGTAFVDVIKYRNQKYNENIKVISFSRRGGESSEYLECIKANVNESVSKATFALLDTHKIKNIGWKPQYSVKDGLKRTYMIKKEQLTNVD